MSDLLNQASLVMVPSGYKEDIVYSVVPTDGSGDLAFTRASNGTRVNSAGLVEVCPWNLFGDSEDGTSGKWGVSVNFASVTANSTTAPNGTNTGNLVIENSANGRHWFEQSFSAISGTPYTISVYFKAKERTQCTLYGYADNGVFAGQIVNFNLSTGTVISQSGTQTNSIENVGNGWYRCSMTLTAQATAVGGGYFAYGLANGGTSIYQGDGTSGLYMWGRQLNTGTLKPYFPTTDRLNVPRLTYQNGGGGCPSLLLEKQSTNLFTYSEDFTNVNWVNEDINVTANASISPDGTQNADKLAPNTSNVDHSIYQTTTTSVVRTFSVYAKADGYNYIFLGSNNNSATDGVFFNLSNGTISQNTSTLTASIESVGNGWYRCIASQASWPTIYALMAVSQNGTGLGFAGNGTSGVLVYGAQLEASSYATSYIPTTSSSATRVVDVCSKTGISSLIGQTEGVMFLDFVFTNTNDVQVIMSLHDNANNKRVEIWANAANLYGFVGGSSPFNIASVTATNGARYKVAVAYKSGDSAYYVNGSQIGTNSTTFTIGLTSLIFDFWGQGYLANSKINQAVIFPTRLTNAELASLTTI